MALTSTENNSAKDTVFRLCSEMQISQKIEKDFLNQIILSFTFRAKKAY